MLIENNTSTHWLVGARLFPIVLEARNCRKMLSIHCILISKFGKLQKANCNLLTLEPLSPKGSNRES